MFFGLKKMRSKVENKYKKTYRYGYRFYLRIGLVLSLRLSVGPAISYDPVFPVCLVLAILTVLALVSAKFKWSRSSGHKERVKVLSLPVVLVHSVPCL